MTDLTNNIDKIIKDDLNSINEIINKYSIVLQDTKKEDIPYIAYIINITINYIKEKFNDLSKELKSWVVFFIRNQYLKGLLNKSSEIPTLIDKFIEYYNTEYEKYCGDVFAVSDYDRDRGFIQYVENKIGG